MKLIEQAVFYKDMLKFLLYANKNYIQKSIKTFEINNTKENKIPKIIHRVWVGNNNKTEIVNKCIKSFDHLNLSQFGYRQKIWDESNSPIHLYKFAKDAYKQKKWAFVSDVLRLHAIYYEGGIYLDTDMEILKKFSNLLHYTGFCSYESENLINMSAFGALPFNPYIKLILDFYKNTSYINCGYYRTANTRIITKIDKLIARKKLTSKNYITILNGNEFLTNNLKGYTRNYGTCLW